MTQPAPIRPAPSPADDLQTAAECLERAALVDLHSAAPAATRAALGLRRETVGGALVSIAAREPSILINRSLGLGLDAPATAETVDRIAALYAAAGVERYFVQVGRAARPAADLPGWLAAAGLTPHRAWMKFFRDAAPPPVAETDLRVERVEPGRADAFAAIVAPAFDLGAAAEPALAALAGRPGWRLYAAFDRGLPVAAAALFVKDGLAWFDWAATTPAARGRGAQRALLARRIADAVDLGCTAMVTATGAAVPGDPQHSYHNIEWAGFRPADLRDNYRRP